MSGGVPALKRIRLGKVCALLVVVATLPSAAQEPSPNSAQVTRVVLGDRTYELPTAWTKDFARIYPRPSERQAFELTGLREKEKLTLNGGSLRPPKLRNLKITGHADDGSSFQQYIERRNAEAKRERWFAKPNETGFTFTDTIGEFLLLAPTTWRWMEQPLFVLCREVPKAELCASELYLSATVSVRYDFFSSDVPKNKWADLDRQVIEFLSALEAK